MRITITAGAPIQAGDLVTPGGLPATSPSDAVAGVAFEDAATGEPCDVVVSGKVKVRVGAGGAGIIAGQVIGASAADADGSVELVDPVAALNAIVGTGTLFFAGVGLENVAPGGEGYINLGPYTGSKLV